MRQQFGGSWTVLKLECVRKYLDAYTQALKFQGHLRTHYIDAFAGTGYVELRDSLPSGQSLFGDPEEIESESRNLLQGSAEQALEVRPLFSKFIFIEQSLWRAQELALVKTRHPEVSSAIEIIQADANTELQRICKSWNRSRDRAVVFLDPFAISVEWETLKAIADTQSMDMWYLFPIMAVNRLLPTDRNPLDICEKRLNSAFGTPNWRNEFYAVRQQPTLLEDVVDEGVMKTGDWTKISAFLVSRLQTIFPAVSPNPRLLRNSTGSPLFLLCFAASNPAGARIAMRIANHILKAS